MKRQWSIVVLLALVFGGVVVGVGADSLATGSASQATFKNTLDPSATSEWAYMTVDLDGHNSVSLALDSAGSPHITYFANDEYSAQDTPTLRYAVKQGSDTWVTEEVIEIEYPEGSALVLDGRDAPHVTYSSLGGDAKNPLTTFVHAFKLDGSWRFEEMGVVENPCRRRDNGVLLIDSSEALHFFYTISYRRPDGRCGERLRYANRVGNNNWQDSTVYEDDNSLPFAVNIDSEDILHLAFTSYEDGIYSLQYSKFSSIDQFSPTVIFREQSGRGMGMISIALDSSNYPRIALLGNGTSGGYHPVYDLYMMHPGATGWILEDTGKRRPYNDILSFFDAQGRAHVVSSVSYGGGIFGWRSATEHYYEAQDGWQEEEITGGSRSFSFAPDRLNNIHGASIRVANSTDAQTWLAYFNKPGDALTYSLSGQVTTPNGAPLAGVEISTAAGHATTDATGHYTITGLPAGTYDVSPTLAGYTFAPETRSVTVPPDADGVDFIGTEPSYCASLVPDALDPNVQPLMLVNGWEGSEGKHSLSEDRQLSFLKAHFAPHGYVEGCNLFYSTAMSPYKWLAENASIIRDNMCLARLEVRKWNPSWNGHFSIIGYSYGGLRARAYLENTQLYETPCPDAGGSGSARFIYVDRLFTLGTPHSGEIGDLPFATFIGIKALWGQEWPALGEMLPPVRVWQNLKQRQSSETRYIFIGGDTRWQVATSISPLWPVYMKWKPAQKLANDFAVHQLSAFGLGMPSNLYPDVQTVETGDLHGQVPFLLDPLGVLESYVNPADTFEQHICGRLGLPGCTSSALSQSAQPNRPNESMLTVVARQQTPTTSAAMPMMEVAAGEIAAGETLEGEFEITGSGAWQTLLNWPNGGLTMTLTDPNGRIIDADVAEADSVIDYLELNTGFGLMASYTFSETVPGSWSYRLASLDDAAFYRVAVVPPLPIVVTASVPDWTPAGEAVPILASVTYDETIPLPGGMVVAKIDRSDGLTDTRTLYDDGAHDDGAAGDGIFGASYLPPSGGYYGLLITASGDYNGDPYQRDANRVFTVAPASAELRDQFSDRGFDESGDGAFDFLEVYATVKVNQTGTYGLTAELFKGTTFISAAFTEVALESGDFLQEIAIRFPAIDIVTARLDGPYTVRNVMLTDERDGTVLIVADDHVHTTAYYSWSAFGQAPTATPTGTSSPTPTTTPTATPTVTSAPPTPTATPTPSITPELPDHVILLPVISRP